MKTKESQLLSFKTKKFEMPNGDITLINLEHRIKDIFNLDKTTSFKVVNESFWDVRKTNFETVSSTSTST